MNFFKNELRKKVFLQMKDKSSFENIAITICRFDKRTRQLSFVSDNSGVAVVNNNEVLDFSKLTHLSASNGKNHIITHETIFELAKGETIFTFNSGFSSQFGGVQHKRYGMINFKNFLIKLSNIDISLRKVEIENTFNAWKGEERQGKDLLILSLEVME